MNPIWIVVITFGGALTLWCAASLAYSYRREKREKDITKEPKPKPRYPSAEPRNQIKNSK